MKDIWKKVRPIIQWALVVFLILSAIVDWGKSTMIYFILAAIILLPIPKFEEALEKIKLKFFIRLIIAFALFTIVAIKNGDERDLERIRANKANSVSSETNNTENKEDSKNDAKKDNKDDSKNDDIRSQIVGTWHYGPSAPIDLFFTFYEDGSWEYESENDASDSGTYEIVDGNTIKLNSKGGAGTRTFKIKSTDELRDESDTALTRYISE